MPNAREIHRATGVIFLKSNPGIALKPFECRSKITVMRLAKDYTQDHICMVLSSILDAEHNQDQLYKSTIQGVSLFLLEGNYKGEELQIARDVVKTLDLGRLRLSIREARLKHDSVRMADRLISLTQEVAL